MSSSETKEGNNYESYSKYDLDGFDKLWDTSLDEADEFISKVKQKDKNDPNEIQFLKKELNSRNFEIEKLRWQLKERDIELKNLYDEIAQIIDLNNKLNDQLEKYEQLLLKSYPYENGHSS